MNAARMWPIAIVAVLGLTVVANGAIWLTANDAARAVVEPDYYRKAVAWDSTLAAAARSAELGWAVETRLLARPAETPVVRVEIVDRTGHPVDGATIAVVAIHNRAAATPVIAQLADTGAGRYQAALDLDRPGMWELRLTIVHGGERYSTSVRRELPAVEATP